MFRNGCRVFLVVVFLLGFAARTPGQSALVGKTFFPGDATDKSGLTDTLSDGTPHNRLGGHGSGIAWTGQGDHYIMVTDRGPADGTTAYRCRMHFVDVTLTPGGARPVTAVLRDTVLLADETGRPFVGLSSAFDTVRPEASLRLDAEGVRVGRSGTIFISDEYGPYVYEFDRHGKRLRVLPVPAKFQVKNPRAAEKEEVAANTSGRVTNRGLEGLAITPDGSKLVAAMQSPLIQDGGRKGTNNRLLEIDLATGSTREFLYQMDSAHLGLSEILAVNEHEFLVIEREGKPGEAARFKKIFRIDLAGATDISDRERLPKAGLPEGVVPVKKQLFLDLLDARFGLARADFPAKIEGLAFGPDLPDGRHLLLVTSDNDLKSSEPTWIFAFALDKDSLPQLRPQIFRAD